MQNLTVTIDGDNYPVLVLPERPNSLLDKVVAKIYQAKTEHVNQAVKRNPKKFPSEFYFELTDEEVRILKSQNVISNPKAFNRSNPKAFTWEGANMLATVLQTDIAIQRSVQIIKAFTALEKIAFSPGEILAKIDDILERMVIQNKMFTILVDEMYRNRNRIKQCFAQLESLNITDLHTSIDSLKHRLQSIGNLMSDFEKKKQQNKKETFSITNSPSQPIKLSSRQKKALKHIENHGQITNKEYRELYKVSQSTAIRELKQMVDISILQKLGVAKNTFYKLNR